MDTVYLGRCESYDQEELDHCVAEIFSIFRQKFQPGQTVFLKPNLVMKKKPEEAVTTHPALVEAVAKIVRTYRCRVIIGDSPGGPFSPVLLKTIYKATGMEDVAARTGSELNFNTEAITVSFPQGQMIKSLTVCKAIWEADHVINLAKFKTHAMTVLTASVKNLFGVIPGLLKAEYHFKMPQYHNFANLLVDICEKIKPCISIVDGISAMEGNGPSAGRPTQLKLLIAGKNPHAVDLICASVIGLKISQVPTLAAAQKRGFISSDKEIKIWGNSLDRSRVKDFKFPVTKNIHFYQNKLPKWLTLYLDRLIIPQPVFFHEICTGCALCKNHCPAGIISMKEGRPEVDLSKCIKCFCCQELCPARAVKIQRSWLADKIFKKNQG